MTREAIKLHIYSTSIFSVLFIVLPLFMADKLTGSLNDKSDGIISAMWVQG